MAEAIRLDRFLWFARLTKTRSAAQAIAEAAHIRIDGRAVDRAHAAVRVGQVITMPHPSGTRVLRIEALPARRGPAAEAAACYRDLLTPAPASDRLTPSHGKSNALPAPPTGSPTQ